MNQADLERARADLSESQTALAKAFSDLADYVAVHDDAELLRLITRLVNAQSNLSDATADLLRALGGRDPE